MTIHNFDTPNRRQTSRDLSSGKQLTALFCFVLMVSMTVGNAAAAHAQANNTIQTVAGGAVASGAANAWDIPGPNAVVEDSSQNLYIASPASYNVFKVTPAGVISVFAGSGIQGFSGDGGPATKATLSSPSGLAIDSAGNIYIADLNRIREVSNSGTITTIAGDGTVCAPSTAACGDGGPATSAQLDAPQGLAVNAAGDVYIADTQDAKIRLVTKSTSVISTIVGTGKLCDGPTETCGDHGPATAAFLDYPTGIILDSLNDVIFTDTRDQRIRCVIGTMGGCNNAVNPVGDLETIVGTGQFCDTYAQSKYKCGNGGPANKARLWNPEGLSQDSAGNFYFADQLDCLVRKVTISTWTITTVGGTGVCGFSGDGAAALNAQFELPYAVLIDPNGNLWVADAGNQRVREIAAGNVSTFAGGGSGGDNGPATQATLADPISVTWDNSGNYFIADTANNRIRKVSGGTISTVAGVGSACVAAPATGSCGNAGLPNVCGDGGPATLAAFQGPQGVVVDGAGNIYVADTLNYSVRQISPTGTITTIAGTPGCQCDPATGACGDGGLAASAQLTYPTALSLDTLGNLYIADYYGSRVRQVNLTTGIINTSAGNGIRGRTGNGGLGTQAELDHPSGVANDAAGNIYISDSGNHQVRCVFTVDPGCGGQSLAVGDITGFAFSGKPGFSGDGGPALKAQTLVPSQVAIDAAGNVYSGGGGNSVIRRIDAATLTVDTVAGNPSKPTASGFSGDGGPATKATLNNDGLSVDAAKQMLIADNGNNRIRQTNMVPALTASTTELNFPATKVGTSSAPMSVTITNIGADDQVLGTFSTTGPDSADFSIKTNTCTALLAPDLSCTVSVVFTPQATGKRTAFLKVSNLPQRLPLSGTGD